MLNIRFTKILKQGDLFNSDITLRNEFYVSVILFFPQYTTNMNALLIFMFLMIGMSLFQDITPCKCDITPCTCDIKFGVAVCPHVRACPEFVKVIRVECQINELITKTQLIKFSYMENVRSLRIISTYVDIK